MLLCKQQKRLRKINVIVFAQLFNIFFFYNIQETVTILISKQIIMKSEQKN